MTEIFLWILSIGILLYSGFLVLQHWGDDPDVLTEQAEMDAQESRLSDQRIKAYKGLRGTLKRLNIDLSPLLVIVGGLMSGIAVFFIFISLFPSKLTLAAIAGASFLPISLLVLKDIAAWKSRRFERALVDIVDLMHSAAVGGTSPLASLSVAAQASRGFVRESIEDVIQRLKLGATIESAANPLVRRYPTEGVQLFVKTLTSRWHSGGDFEGLLAALGRILRDRSAFRQQLKAQLSGARYALIFAAFFPYILIPFFMWKEPDWLTPLTTHPMGPTFMFSAVVCQIFGFLIMRKILRSDM